MATKMSSMSPQELNSFIAMHVMDNVVRADWNPSANLNDAFAALEKLKEDRDWWYTIDGRTCFHIDITDGTDQPIVPPAIYDDNLADGICRHIVACVSDILPKAFPDADRLSTPLTKEPRK